MTSLRETYEKLMRFIRLFVNRAPERYAERYAVLTMLPMPSVTSSH